MAHNLTKLFTSLVLSFSLAGHCLAKDINVATSLGQSHLWVSSHMEPFVAEIEKRLGNDISVTKFYAGELTSVGRELDALNSETIQVAAPLLAPFHEGQFPLSDVTQLPVYGTDAPMVTRAFQKLLDSNVQLKDGKTFYEYEIAGKGIRAWALGATSALAISTGKKKISEPSDLAGMPMSAGSAIHTMMLRILGATPVTLGGPFVYEALSRGTIDGVALVIADWKSYSLQDLLTYTIVDLSIGHWESYLAVSNTFWDSLSSEQQAIWDEVARQTALDNAKSWEDTAKEVIEISSSQKGGVFISINDLSQEMQTHVAKSATETWFKWIEQTEASGHPAKHAAKLYAQFITEEGAKLPDGVAEYLGL